MPADSKQPPTTMSEGLQPVNMAARQQPLCAAYREQPERALIIDKATTFSANIAAGMPLNGEVRLEGGRPIDLTYGVHKAVGGEGDYPVPGEILCAAIAACLDSTIRIIANRMGIPLNTLAVDVEAQVDVRGTLLVDKTVPVGFQQVSIAIHVDVPDVVTPRQVESLVKAAEYSCVVLQTIKNSPDFHLSFA
jgi:uncharacterized OsmC-like protein